MRVTVNLLTVSDGSSLWAETFNLSFKDLFALEDEVSRQIAARLRLKLSQTEAARIAKRNPANPEAYNYYAKAMYHFYNISPSLSTRSESNLAVDLFKKAIELTPTYADAYYQYGMTLSSKMQTTADGKVTAPPGMAEAFQKYLELQPNGPNAEAAKAMLQSVGSSVQTKFSDPSKKADPKKKK